MLLIGFVQFKILFIRQRPKSIITFGSYASFTPILCAAIFKKFFKTKIYFHEQNSVIGRVHKFFLFVSDKIFVTFENTKGIDSKYNTIHSGFPIRKDVEKYKKIKLILSKNEKKLNF